MNLKPIKPWTNSLEKNTEKEGLVPLSIMMDALCSLNQKKKSTLCKIMNRLLNSKKVNIETHAGFK